MDENVGAIPSLLIQRKKCLAEKVVWFTIWWNEDGIPSYEIFTDIH